MTSLPVSNNFNRQYFTGFSANEDSNKFEFQCKPVTGRMAALQVFQEAANFAAAISLSLLAPAVRCDELNVPMPDGRAWRIAITVTRRRKGAVVFAIAYMADGVSTAFWVGSVDSPFRP